MRQFHNHNFPKIKRVQTDQGRVYETPSGNRYPSVTTVVGLDKRQYINEWRKKVGEEVANQITQRASKRGTAIHSLCEQYILTGKAEPSIFDHEMFHSIRPELDKIQDVHCLETQMYSDTIEVAGTVDCIGVHSEYGLSVIDFKTSKKHKTIDMIPDYFMQCGAYCMMFEEHTNLTIDSCVIIIGVDDSDKPLVYRKDPDQCLQEFKSIRARYKAIHHL